MRLGICEAWRARISLLQGHKLTIYDVHPSIARDLNLQSQRSDGSMLQLSGQISNMGSKKPSFYACEAITCGICLARETKLKLGCHQRKEIIQILGGSHRLPYCCFSVGWACVHGWSTEDFDCVAGLTSRFLHIVGLC